MFKNVLNLFSHLDPIINKFIGDPAQQKQLKKEIIELIFKDKESARALHKIRLASNDPFIRRFVPIYGLLLTLFSLGVIVALFWLNIPKQNGHLISMAIGSIIGYMGTVVTFYFGTNNNKNNE